MKLYLRVATINMEMTYETSVKIRVPFVTFRATYLRSEDLR